MAGIGFLVVMGVALVLLIKGLYPIDLPESRDPDFVDTVFDNRGVIWAARLLLALGQAEVDVGLWRRAALESEEEATNLRERLRHFDKVFENL